MKSLITNSDFLGFISALLSVLVTIYIFKVTPKYQLVKERYDKLIFPIFNELEPYLFTPVKVDVLNKVLNIINDNKIYAGGKLIEVLYLCQKNPSQENYNTLCRYINNEYDNLCLRLGLKRRSIVYKINRRQFNSKFMLIVNFLFFITIQLIAFAIITITFLLILGFIILKLEKVGFLTPSK